MISFAGVTLDFPSPDVLSWAQRHLSYQWLRLWDDLPGSPARPLQALPVRAWDPWPVRNPQALPARPWLREGPLRLNTLLWPSGASRWGVFHALVDDAAMTAIKAATGSFGQPLVIDDGSSPVLSVTMYPLPPRPLPQIPGANGLQLLTLLDRRAYWPWLSAEIDVVGGVTAWADLFGLIASALGIALTADPVPAAYLSPPAALSGAYDSLPALLDAACLSCGLRFAAALDGTSYRCWSVAAAQAQAAANLAAVTNPRVAGGIFLQGTDLNGVLPAAVRVVFPRADDGVPSPVPSVGLVTLASLNLPSNPPGGPAVGGVGGLTKTFHSSAVATFASGSATNAVTLATLATQAATDFYAWQATGVYDVAFAGVVPWLPTGADGLVEYAHAPDGGAGGGVLSRFRRDAYFDGQEALWHHTATPCAAIPTRVRVTGTTLTDGCLWAAELVVRSGCVDAAVSPPAACWLRVDGPALAGTPPWVPGVGDVYMASPEGVRAADGVPAYVTRGPFGPSGPAHSFGLVPDPGPTAGTARYLREDATWHAPPAGGTGGGGVVASGDTLEVQAGGTLLLDSGAIFVLAGPTWNFTASTTANISAGVALTFVGGNVSTSVIDITSLSWKYESTSVLVFAGPTWNVTASTTCTISSTTNLTFVGVSSTTSLVNVNSLTWNYNSTSVLVFAGPTWNITQNTTTTVSALTTWNVTGGSVSTSQVSVTNLTWTYGPTTVLVLAGPTVNLTANQTWTVSLGDTWTVTGGNFAVNSTFVFGGPSFTFNLTTNYVYLCGDLVFDVCATPHNPTPVVRFPIPVVPQGGFRIPGPTPGPVVLDPGVTWPVEGGGPGRGVIQWGPLLDWEVVGDTTGTIDPGKTATIQGGILDLVGLVMNWGTGLSWGVTDDVTATIAPGKVLTIGGPGTLDLTGVTTAVGPTGGSKQCVTDVQCVGGVIVQTKDNVTFLSTGLTGPVSAMMARLYG